MVSKLVSLKKAGDTETLIYLTRIFSLLFKNQNSEKNIYAHKNSSLRSSFALNNKLSTATCAEISIVFPGATTKAFILSPVLGDAIRRLAKLLLLSGLRIVC